MANMLYCESTIEYLEKNPKITKELMTSLLSFLKEKLPTSVLKHILLSLLYLSNDKFAVIRDECQFSDRISDFVEYYA